VIATAQNEWISQVEFFFYLQLLQHKGIREVFWVPMPIHLSKENSKDRALPHEARNIWEFSTTSKNSGVVAGCEQDLALCMFL
jgi:hypothetical protein